jgi:hypothetical protein
MTPTIRLHLAHIHGNVLVTLRGPVRGDVDFYSWVWADGKHGGARLFRPAPGSNHVVFLRQENGYLHTVGDYPSYALELSSSWLPALLAAWNSSRESSIDPLERLVSLRLHAEFDGLSAKELLAQIKESRPIPRDYDLPDLPDLVQLAGAYFVATQLDDICRHSQNRFGSAAACDVTGRVFPGRCQAYTLATESAPEAISSSFAARALRSCGAEKRELIGQLRSHDLPQKGLYGWKPTPENLRVAMRLYASAMDADFQIAACVVAAEMPEASDIPECPGVRPR